jgi:hypothetical protein
MESSTKEGPDADAECGGGRLTPARADRPNGPLAMETSMNTHRLSIVAIATLSAGTVSLAQSGGPSAADPQPKCPVCLRAENVKRQTGVPALEGAPVVQLDKEKEKARDPAAATADFSVEGMFVDVCCCLPPCPCEVTDVAEGCLGVGAHQFRSGKYAGDDLSGAKIAHAKVVGEWVILYIEATDEKQRAAAEKFGRAAFGKFGPIKEVKAARIEVAGADGRYTVTVDGGKIMKFETEPVLGGDGKTPVGYTNIKNAVNPTVYQGKCISATYSDGERKFKVEKGRNSHFNSKLKSSGKI